MDNNGVSLGQIALRVGLARSTVQRIVNSLVAEGLVTTGDRTTGYSLGPEVLLLAKAMHQDITVKLHPLLESLSKQAGETVDLAMFRNDAMIFIDQVVGNQRLRTVSAIGETFPMTETANGKAALVLLDKETVNRVIAAKVGRSNKNEAAKALQVELNKVIQLGYALDIDEHTDGISAVGIAFECNSQIYALSIPAPTGRFLDKQITLIEQLESFKAEITRVLPETRFS